MFRYKTLQRPSEKTFHNPTALLLSISDVSNSPNKNYLKNRVLKSAHFLLNIPVPIGG